MNQRYYYRAISSLTALFISCTLSNIAHAETSILLTLMNASRSVVQIESENAQMVRRPGPSSQVLVSSSKYVRTGTGIIIDSHGIIATNAHSVIQAARIHVNTFDGQKYLAKPLVLDRANDLCLLKIIPERSLQALPLADVSKVTLNAAIYSIGGSNFLKNTLSEGKVTGMGFSKLNTKTASKKQTRAIKLFQINLDLYQGDSGSPILNASGEVIGIISAAAKRRGKTAFAIPSSYISAHLATLLQQEQILP